MALFTAVYTAVCMKSKLLVERSARTVPPHINTQTITRETKEQYDWIYAAKRALETFDPRSDFDTLQISPYRQYAICFMRGLQLLAPSHVKNRVNDLIFLCILEPTIEGVACAIGVSKLSKNLEISSKTVNFEQLLNHELNESTFDIISEKNEYDSDSDSNNHSHSNNEDKNNQHATIARARKTDSTFYLKSKEFAFVFLSKIRNEFTNNFVNELSNVLNYKQFEPKSSRNKNTIFSSSTSLNEIINKNSTNNINIDNNKKEFNTTTDWKAIEIRDNLDNFGSFMYHQMKGHKCTKYKYESYANIETLTNYNNSKAHESLPVAACSSESLEFMKFPESSDFNEKLNENYDKLEKYDAFNKIDESELTPEKILAQTEFINKKYQKRNKKKTKNDKNNDCAKSETKNENNNKNERKPNTCSFYDHQQWECEYNIYKCEIELSAFKKLMHGCNTRPAIEG